MIVASCHCGDVRLELRQAPRTVVSCNCSICRRYGALWAYYRPSSVRIRAHRGALARYAWRLRVRDYCHCRRCGCVTHYVYRGRQRERVMGINARLLEPAVLAGVRIRRLDGAKTWKLLD